MKERFMIVRIVNIIQENKDGLMLTEPCYQIIDKDYETLDSAYRVKQNYEHPFHYIIVSYWC